MTLPSATAAPTVAFLEALPLPAALLDADARVVHANHLFYGWIPCDEGDTLTPSMLPGEAVQNPVELDGHRLNLLMQLPTAGEIDAASGLPSIAAASLTLRKMLEAATALRRHVAALVFDCESIRRAAVLQGQQEAHFLEASVGGRIRSWLRRGRYAFSAGAGRFGVLVVDIDHPDQAVLLAERWLAALSEPFIHGGREVSLRPSCGVAVSPEHGDTPDELLGHAQAAALDARSAARSGAQGAVRPYSMETARHHSEALQLEHDLARALRHGEFSLALQPKVEWHDGVTRLAGAEALLRWTHPDLGPVSPARFIPLAEQSGLMGAIGDWVAERACALQADWRQRGVATVPLAINVSGHQLTQSDFRWRVENWLRRAGLGVGDISLEITESALLADVEQSIRLLRALVDMGVSIAIDDFGTGYSSLAYLRRFPFDLLKIDKTFVQGIEHDAQAAGILQAIVAMSDVLGIDLIVEGVEQPAQLQHLHGLGCRLFQGYLFDRPLTPEAFEHRWLAALAARQPATGAAR